MTQVARHQGRQVFAFTRPGDAAAQEFARGLGAVGAGGSDQPPPEPLDAAIIFAPAGALVPIALRAVRKGGTVVCGGIHMSDIPAFPYRDLRHERTVCSVANLTISRWLGHKDGGAPAMRVCGHLRQEHSFEMSKRVTFEANPASGVGQTA